MTNRRRMRHVEIDVGEGITAMVRLRGPVTAEFEAAFAEVAKAALAHVRTLCACGHNHVGDEDGADAGCRVCECLTWTSPLRLARRVRPEAADRRMFTPNSSPVSAQKGAPNGETNDGGI